MLPPKAIHQAINQHHAEMNDLIQKNPWLIPATLALNIIPVAISAHGFWQARQLHLKLKIEREKTKQIAVEQVGAVKAKIKTEPAHHHCPAFIHHHLCQHFMHH